MLVFFILAGCFGVGMVVLGHTMIRVTVSRRRFDPGRTCQACDELLSDRASVDCARCGATVPEAVRPHAYYTNRILFGGVLFGSGLGMAIFGALILLLMLGSQ